MKLSFKQAVSVTVGLVAGGQSFAAKPNDLPVSGIGTSPVIEDSDLERDARVSVKDTVSIPAPSNFKWTKTREREFSDLAALKALKRSNEEQEMRLMRLQELRRRYKNPVQGDNVIYQFKKQMIQSEIMKALAEYERLTRAEGSS